MKEKIERRISVHSGLSKKSIEFGEIGRSSREKARMIIE